MKPLEYMISISVHRLPAALESEEQKVYQEARFVEAGRQDRIFDIIDDLKMIVSEAIDEDIPKHCEHPAFEYDDVDVCNICGYDRTVPASSVEDEADNSYKESIGG